MKLTFKTLATTLLLTCGVASAQQFSDWSTPVNLNFVPGQTTPINSGFNDQHPGISKDGLSLYFSSDRNGLDSSGRPISCGGLDIWVTQRASTDSPWEPPFNLDADRLARGLPCVFDSSANDLAPNLSTDGHELYFHSFRLGGCGGGDIYVAHRKDRRDDKGWEAPVNLNQVGRDPGSSLICGIIGDTNLVNTPNTDAGPNLFQDDSTGTTVLYFTRSNQPTQTGDFDIYTATLGSDGTWGTVVRDNELSTTPYRDTRTAIRRRDGLEMILSSERPGGLGDSRDLWVSTRASTLDPWSIPVLLHNVNSTTLDGAPALSWDGTELYFFSSRPGGIGFNDLYISTRAKIIGQ